MRPLSYSQISLYQTCPLCYKLQYVDGLKPKDKWYFSFGSTLHACAEYFFKVKVPPPPSVDELFKFYEGNWLSQGFESVDEEAKYKSYGKELLTKFHEIHNSNFHMPFAIENLFNINIEGIRLTGFIDRVDKLDSGKLSIVDYKTNQQPFTADYVENNLQLTLYQLAAEQTWHLPVEKLTLYHLRSNTPCSCEARQKKELDEARRLVLEVANNIVAEKFPPVENSYCPCDFPEFCPYQRHLHIPAQTTSETQAPLKGMATDEVIERYVTLQNQIKEIQLQLDELKQMIIDFCQAEGLNRIYGREHAITYKLVERTGYNDEDVRKLLEPAGLWQQVLSFDQTKLQSLITDESIAGDIKNKLTALKQVISTYPRLTVKKLIEEE